MERVGGPQRKGCALSFPREPHSLSPVFSAGHGLPLLGLADTYVTFETRATCQSSGKPSLPSLPLSASERSLAHAVARAGLLAQPGGTPGPGSAPGTRSAEAEPREEGELVNLEAGGLGCSLPPPSPPMETCLTRLPEGALSSPG